MRLKGRFRKQLAGQRRLYRGKMQKHISGILTPCSHLTIKPGGLYQGMNYFIILFYVIKNNLKSMLGVGSGQNSQKRIYNKNFGY